MNKTKIGYILFAITIAMFTIIILLVLGKGHKQPAEETTKSSALSIKDLSANIRIDNIDGLYFISDDNTTDFKNALSSFLISQNYHNVDVVDIVGEIIDNQDKFTFWLYVPIHNIVLNCQYDLNTKQTEFSLEKDKNILSNMLGITSTIEDGDFESVDEENILNIKNIDLLNDYLNKEEIELLLKDFENFLVNQKEYRRSFAIKENTIKNTQELLSFDCYFINKKYKDNFYVSIEFYKHGVVDFKFVNE